MITRARPPVNKSNIHPKYSECPMTSEKMCGLYGEEYNNVIEVGAHPIRNMVSEPDIITVTPKYEEMCEICKRGSRGSETTAPRSDNRMCVPYNMGKLKKERRCSTTLDKLSGEHNMSMTDIDMYVSSCKLVRDVTLCSVCKGVTSRVVATLEGYVVTTGSQKRQTTIVLSSTMYIPGSVMESDSKIYLTGNSGVCKELNLEHNTASTSGINAKISQISLEQDINFCLDCREVTGKMEAVLTRNEAASKDNVSRGHNVVVKGVMRANSFVFGASNETIATSKEAIVMGIVVSNNGVVYIYPTERRLEEEKEERLNRRLQGKKELDEIRESRKGSMFESFAIPFGYSNERKCTSVR